MSEFTTFAYIDGQQAQNVRRDLNGWGDDPTVRIKLKVKGGNALTRGLFGMLMWLMRRCSFALQVCTDSWGGGDENASKPCPGSPGC